MGSVKRKQVRAENGRMGSLHAMLTRYPDERSCERRLIEVRWPEGWVCPECGCRTCSPVADRNRTWQCTRCSRQFSVTAGTAMQGSKVHLRRWFHAMWLVARSKRGVSAIELAAQVGVSENTARYMLERLRGAMARSECANVLSGDVELDDFYLDARDGGRVRRAGRGTDGQPMVCAVERTEGSRGSCVLRVVPDVSGATYGRFAAEHVDRAARVLADAWSGITAGLRGWDGLRQRKFDAADDDARLPTVHHVISNFEAWVQGTFHGLSTVRLQSYADEFSWRYSHRGTDATTALLADCCLGHYTLAELRTCVFAPQPAPPAPQKRGPRRPRKAA